MERSFVQLFFGQRIPDDFLAEMLIVTPAVSTGLPLPLTINCREQADFRFGSSCSSLISRSLFDIVRKECICNAFQISIIRGRCDPHTWSPTPTNCHLVTQTPWLRRWHLLTIILSNLSWPNQFGERSWQSQIESKYQQNHGLWNNG